MSNSLRSWTVSKKLGTSSNVFDSLKKSWGFNSRGWTFSKKSWGFNSRCLTISKNNREPIQGVGRSQKIPENLYKELDNIILLLVIQVVCFYFVTSSAVEMQRLFLTMLNLTIGTLYKSKTYKQKNFCQNTNCSDRNLNFLN